MVISLNIYGRAGAPSALGPVANDLVAVEKRQDKTVRQVNRIREESLSLLLGSNHTVILQGCVNMHTGISWLSEHQQKPKAIGTLAASFNC